MRTHTHMQDRCVSMIYFLQLLGSADGLFCLLWGGSCTWSVRLTTSVCLLQIDLLKFLLSKELDFTIVPFKSTWEILAHSVTAICKYMMNRWVPGDTFHCKKERYPDIFQWQNMKNYSEHKHGRAVESLIHLTSEVWGLLCCPSDRAHLRAALADVLASCS